MSAARSTPAAGQGSERNGPSGVVLAPESVEAVAARVAALLAPAPVEGALLDADAAARLLGVPASWVLQEARAERIPHVRLGRYVRFDPDELRAWWTDGRTRGPRRARTGEHPVPRGARGR